MEPLKCDANCDPCEGTVRPVVVAGEKWGTCEFNYCDYAIEHDRKEGFKVEELAKN